MVLFRWSFDASKRLPVFMRMTSVFGVARLMVRRSRLDDSLRRPSLVSVIATRQQNATNRCYRPGVDIGPSRTDRTRSALRCPSRESQTTDLSCLGRIRPVRWSRRCASVCRPPSPSRTGTPFGGRASGWMLPNIASKRRGGSLTPTCVGELAFWSLPLFVAERHASSECCRRSHDLGRCP